MDTARLDQLLGNAVSTGAIPGVIGIVGDRDKPLYASSFGTIDVRTGASMPLDAILRIASLSKALAAIAALQLVEQGVLDLATPVGDIFPDYDDLKVIAGFDGETPILESPLARGTVKHLLTHTSGLTYDAFDVGLLRYGKVTGIPMPVTGLLSAFQSPFVAQPGSRFAYGMSTDWTGRIIEKLSGLSLEEYYRRNICEPLGIVDMTFSPSPDQWSRVAPVHLVNNDDTATVIDFELPTEREFDPAGHGLYATALDYLRIQRLLLRGGELDGVRLLESETVADMFSNHIGELEIEPIRSALPEFSRDVHLPAGVKWGLDILVTDEARPGYRPTGSAGWCGTFNSFYWIDPKNGITGALHTQYLPFYDERAVGLFEEFERAVYAVR